MENEAEMRSGGHFDEIEQTQDYNDSYDMTMQAPSPTRLEENPRSNVWGSLRRKGGDQEEVRLEHRTIDGKRDTYVIGRSKGADITVEDKRVSSQHCKVHSFTKCSQKQYHPKQSLLPSNPSNLFNPFD